jgi:hypothetical protein
MKLILLPAAVLALPFVYTVVLFRELVAAGY